MGFKMVQGIGCTLIVLYGCEKSTAEEVNKKVE